MFKMFRQSSNSENEQKSSAQPESAVLMTAPAAGASVDIEKMFSELLSHASLQGMLESALSYLATAIGGDLKGYAVMRREHDQIEAVLGYPRSLEGVRLTGPWAEGRPRVSTAGGSELLPMNSDEVRSVLEKAGMGEASASLVLRLTDKGSRLGWLVLDRVGQGFTAADEEKGQRLTAMMTPVIGLMAGRDEARTMAQTISTSVIEAIESLDFDSVGHAKAVAALSVLLGRATGLSEREVEELNYAATLHDIGKILGEEGHAQVGANLLHGLNLSAVQSAIRHHHERWDGQGTPDQLAGADIPLYARIITVANAYVHVRDMDVMRSQAGLALDPSLVTALDKLDQAGKLQDI